MKISSIILAGAVSSWFFSGLEVKAASLETNFRNCSEYVGLAPVFVNNVRGLLPQSYTIAETESGIGNLVVRSVQCEEVSVNQSPSQPSIITQIGVNIVSPDGTGDINNYLLWYATDNSQLAEYLQLEGVDAQLVPGLTYTVTQTGNQGNLAVNVPLPAEQTFNLSGTVTEPDPSEPSLLYTANWWQSQENVRLKMQTIFPDIRFGDAEVTLYTDPETELYHVIGGDSITFTTFEVRGRFDEAQLSIDSVSVPEPSFKLAFLGFMVFQISYLFYRNR